MRRYLAMLAIAALTVAAACGGGGGGNKNASKSDSSDSKSDKGSSKGDSDSGDDSGGSGDGSTGSKEIDALLEKQKEAVIKITYENDDGSTYTIARTRPSSPTRPRTAAASSSAATRP